MDIGAIILAMGIPSAITSLVVWWIKRYIDKQEQKRELHEKNVEQIMLIIMRSSRANNVLATATARAVQRIPDAKCNGDMTKALEEATALQKEEKDFLYEQGIRYIFED